jgi:CopG antitoxin of type II toxin-antitoxin system
MRSARFPDPYEGMTLDELDRHFATVLTNHRERQQAISIRFPAELLTAIRSLAREHGVAYQTLIKQLLERDVERLRARRPAPRRATGTHATSTREQTTGKSPASANRSSSSSPTRRSRTGKRRVGV